MKEIFDIFSINDRIILIMRNKKFNKNSFSKLLNFSQPAIKKIEDKTNLPSLKLLFELLNAFPDINSEWLITGNGEMYKKNCVEKNSIKNHEDIIDKELFDKLLFEVDILKDKIHNLENLLAAKDEIISLLKKT